MFLNCSTGFGRHTAHHQELKKCNYSPWFYIRFWLPAAEMAQPTQRRQSKTHVKPQAAITVFELLMMGGVSPETCWTIKKHWSNKIYYKIASCWFFSMRMQFYLHSQETCGSHNVRFTQRAVHTTWSSHNVRFTQRAVHTTWGSQNVRFTQREVHTTCGSHNGRFTQRAFHTTFGSHNADCNKTHNRLMTWTYCGSL
jgi:hypothetical protein